jgi:response regulator of citrate/malate metabolism
MSKSQSMRQQLRSVLKTHNTINQNELARLLLQTPESKARRKEERGMVGSTLHKLGKSFGKKNNRVYQDELNEIRSYLKTKQA